MLTKIRLLAAFLLTAPCLNAVEDRPPNIVFILADDLGYQDVGFNGSKWFETPQLDALAKHSVVFRNACTYPTCSPSRAALLTGRHSFRTQIYTVPVLEKGNAQDNIFSRWTVETKHPFYAAPLNKAGYKLIHLGKWHVVGPEPNKEDNYPFSRKLGQPGNAKFNWVEQHKSPEIQQYYPTGKGFHENVAGCWWGDPARGQPKGYQSKGGGYESPYNNPFIENGPKGEWLTDRLTDEAIRFIGENKDSPFFVNLHFYSPHRPSVARSPERLKKFRAKPADSNTGQHSSSTKEMAAYATMVENVDQNVGKLVDYLEQQNLLENTVIIFTSDNGYNVYQSSNSQLRGHKGTIYEGGIRVPALISWKGKIQPSVCSQTVTLLDYFPTFLDLAGIKNSYTDLLDGNSILPLIQNPQTKSRTLFWHIASNYKHPACSMVRQGDWKLIQFLKSGKIELYNLKQDPREERDLSVIEKQKQHDLLTLLTQWRKTNNVPLPPSSPLPY